MGFFSGAEMVFHRWQSVQRYTGTKILTGFSLGKSGNWNVVNGINSGWVGGCKCKRVVLPFLSG